MRIRIINLHCVPVFKLTIFEPTESKNISISIRIQNFMAHNSRLVFERQLLGVRMVSTVGAGYVVELEFTVFSF
jgi:hypothetical protein